MRKDVLLFDLTINAVIGAMVYAILGVWQIGFLWFAVMSTIMLAWELMTNEL